MLMTPMLLTLGCSVCAHAPVRRRRGTSLSFRRRASEGVSFLIVIYCRSSTPGFPVRHQLLEPAQTHVHRVGDAIQPSPLSSPSPPALNLSQQSPRWGQTPVEPLPTSAAPAHAQGPAMLTSGIACSGVSAAPAAPSSSPPGSPSVQRTFNSRVSKVLSQANACRRAVTGVGRRS